MQVAIGKMGGRVNEYERLFGESPFNVCKYGWSLRVTYIHLQVQVTMVMM